MTANGHGRLRIAQVAPLHESVPPRLYGGTERIVSYLTEELVTAGHDVTLFASGDSQTTARLIAGCPRALRRARCTDTLALHLAMVEQVARRARDFDVVHWHIDYLHFPVSRREPYRHVTTLHGRLALADNLPVFARFADLPVVSISDAQRAPPATRDRAAGRAARRRSTPPGDRRTARTPAGCRRGRAGRAGS